MRYWLRGHLSRMRIPYLVAGVVEASVLVPMNPPPHRGPILLIACGLVTAMLLTLSAYGFRLARRFDVPELDLDRVGDIACTINGREMMLVSVTHDHMAPGDLPELQVSLVSADHYRRRTHVGLDGVL